MTSDKGRIYDGRPHATRLAERLRRDGFSAGAEVRPMLSSETNLTTGRPYGLIVSAVFEVGRLTAAFRTRRDGRIERFHDASLPTLREPTADELAEAER